VRPTTHPARWVLAAAVVMAYVATATVTAWVVHEPARPLYDATGVTPIPYRWVRPPTEFSVDNVRPTSLQTDVAPGSTVQAGTSDGQAVLSIPRGALPPRTGDVSVAINVIPVDPATLHRLPDGLAADGNAYKVSFTYEPSGTALPSTAAPFDIVLREPQFGLTDHNVMLTPSTTQTWRQLASVQSGTVNRAAVSDQAGYYLISGTTVTSSGLVTRVLEVTGGAIGILLILFIGIRVGRRAMGS
jgi:hypothetical protein